MTDQPRTEPRRDLRSPARGVRSDLILLAGADENGVRSLNEWCAMHLPVGARFTRLHRIADLVPVDAWSLSMYGDWSELVQVLPSFDWKAPDEVFLYVNEASDRPPVVFCCTGRYRLPMIPR